MIKQTSNGEKYWLGIPSRNRPEQIVKMTLGNPRLRHHKPLGPATWYVNEFELDDYAAAAKEAKIDHLVKIRCRPEPGLAKGRQLILDDAFGRELPAVSFDDDLHSTAMCISHIDCVPDMQAYQHFQRTKILITPQEAIDVMFRRAKKWPQFKLCCTRSDAQAMGMTGYLSHHRATTASAMLVQPSEPRFRSGIINEDYDFYFQHMAKYGGIINNLDLLLLFDFARMPGGVGADRNPEMQAKVRAYFKENWPDYLEERSDKDSTRLKYRFLYQNIKKDFLSKDSAVRYRRQVDAQVMKNLVEIGAKLRMSPSEVLLKIVKCTIKCNDGKIALSPVLFNLTH